MSNLIPYNPTPVVKAYYNEHDPKAAAWLRELIKQGLIAPGDVDERSIEDVLPAELIGYTQCHFFAGIGVWSHALRKRQDELSKIMFPHIYNAQKEEVEQS